MKHHLFCWVAAVSVLAGFPSVLVAETLSGRFFLVDAEEHKTIRRLREGDVLTLDTLPGNITVIFVPESPNVRSVTFELNGYSRFRHETMPPFSLVGDERGRYNAWTPRLGRNEITARADGRPPETSRVTFSVQSAGPEDHETVSPEERVREFVRIHHARSQENDLDEILDLYADRVDYYDRGLIGRDAIRQDKLYYLNRWPARRYDIEDVQVFDTAREHEKRVVFYTDYSVKGRGKTSTGRAKNEFVLRITGDDVKIIGERSEVARSGAGSETAMSGW